MTTLRDKMKENMTLKGLALGTQTRYLRAVIKLHDYYKCSPAKLADEQIKSFLLEMLSEKIYVPSTYNVMIHGLKFFYETVLHRKMVEVCLPRIKEPQKLPDILSPAEVTRIIKATRDLKYRTILIVVYGAGLRASEVVGLTAQDIDSERGVIHIRQAKGNKDRYVMLSPVMLKSLRLYWQNYRVDQKNIVENNLIFTNHSGKMLSPQSVSTIYKKSKRLAGIDKQGSVHALRHAFATHALEMGVSIYTIKQLLGHASMTSTVRYLRMTSDHLKVTQSPIEQLDL